MCWKTTGIISSLLIIVGLAVTGCSEPADVAGSYTIAVTNGANGCNLNDWTEGNTAEGIPVTITQDGESATAVVEGLTGAFLAIAFGSNQYSGDVSGNGLNLTLYGTNSVTEGNCTYTYNSVIDADLLGDILQGEIRYEAATTGNPDCAEIEGCASIQQFNGTRPPTVE